MKILLLHSVFLLMSQLAFSQGNVREEIVANTVKLGNINFEGQEFSGYEAIAGAIGNARVVLLGEQDHGDASSMSAKAKLVKYLHELHGFNVIAFESDFYALQQLQEQSTGADFEKMMQNIYPVWTKCNQLTPFFEYLKSRGPKMVITGFDVRHALPFTQANFPAHFGQVMQSVFADSARFVKYKGILQNVLKEEYSNQASEAEKSFFLTTTNEISAKLAAGSHPDKSFWLQEMKNLKAYVENAWYSKLSAPKDFRDRQMADNLWWLATVKYPHQKIIVWSANSHIGKKSHYYNYTSMGNSLADKFPGQLFVMGFDSYQGTSKRTTLPESLVIPTPAKNSFEQWLKETDHEFAFVNLGKISDNKGFSMKGYNHMPQKEKWHQVFDGIIYIRDMQPCTTAN